MLVFAAARIFLSPNSSKNFRFNDHLPYLRFLSNTLQPFVLILKPFAARSTQIRSSDFSQSKCVRNHLSIKTKAVALPQTSVLFKVPMCKIIIDECIYCFFKNHIIVPRSDEETSSVFSNRLQHLLQLIPHVTLYPLCWLNTLTADWRKPLNGTKSKTSCCFCWCFVRNQVNILRYILHSEIVKAQGI